MVREIDEGCGAIDRRDGRNGRRARINLCTVVLNTFCRVWRLRVEKSNTCVSPRLGAACKRRQLSQLQSARSVHTRYIRTVVRHAFLITVRMKTSATDVAAATTAVASKRSLCATVHTAELQEEHETCGIVRTNQYTLLSSMASPPWPDQGWLGVAVDSLFYFSKKAF